MILALALFVAPVALPAPQTVGGMWSTRYSFDGTAPDSFFGTSVGGGGDVDGDGVPDLLVGGMLIGNGGGVLVYSGADGHQIHFLQLPTPLTHLGRSVANLGDLDGDGLADFVAGAPEAGPNGALSGQVWVFAGSDGHELFHFDGRAAGDYLGRWVAGPGDVNGDGIPDVLAGAPYSSPNGFESGTAFVWSGADGSLLHEWHGGAAGDWFGKSVGAAGDVDGDGLGDLIVGSPFTDPNGLVGAGSAFVYSGATGQLLYRWDGDDNWVQQGRAVSGAGDVNGDGFADLAVGRPYADFSARDAGSLFVYSGADGSLLWRVDGEAKGDQFGFSIAPAGDVDGDGQVDVVTGCRMCDPGGRDGAGAVYVLDGADGSLITRLEGAAAGDHLGQAVAGVGDLDGSGRASISAGAWTTQAAGRQTGSAYVYTWEPVLTLDSGMISASGPSVLASCDFPSSEAGRGFALFASAGTGPSLVDGLLLPLAHDAILSSFLGGWTPSSWQGSPGTLDANGDGSVVIGGGSAVAPFIGRTFYLAAVSYDPATLHLRGSSVARALTVVP